jgi:hypothetical protein
VHRRLTLLATLLLLPGGLVAVALVALLLLAMRSERGRRCVVVARRRLPLGLQRYLERGAQRLRALAGAATAGPQLPAR